MTPQELEVLEDQFSARLASYDEALATGQLPEPVPDPRCPAQRAGALNRPRNA